jgi:hypothetical protein
MMTVLSYSAVALFVAGLCLFFVVWVGADA